MKRHMDFFLRTSLSKTTHQLTTQGETRSRLRQHDVSHKHVNTNKRLIVGISAGLTYLTSTFITLNICCVQVDSGSQRLPYLFPGCGPIWLCGVEAGVGGFRSPGASVRELLLD